MPVPPATTITGTSGDDDLFGTVSDDVIDGLEGNDFISAGDGSDWVTYQNAPGLVQVFLGPTGFGSASGGYGDDSFSGIENIVGSNFDDHLGQQLQPDRDRQYLQRAGRQRQYVRRLRQ